MVSAIDKKSSYNTKAANVVHARCHGLCRSGGTAPNILKIGTEWKIVVIFTL
jgi:hypothetical protein